MKRLCLVIFFLALSAASYAQKSAKDVFVMDGDNRIQMKYSLAEIQGSHNVLGAKTYHTLNGQKSDLRIKTNTPQFLFYSDPAEKLSEILIRFDVKSDRREIRWIKVTSVGSTLHYPRIMSLTLKSKRSVPSPALGE